MNQGQTPSPEIKKSLSEKIAGMTQEDISFLKELIGTSQRYFGMDTLLKFSCALPDAPHPLRDFYEIDALLEFKPQNGLELMLYTQVVSLHSQGMDQIRRGNPNNAIKFLQQQQAAVEALTKLRKQVAPQTINPSINVIINQVTIEARGDTNNIYEVPHEHPGINTSLPGAIETNGRTMQELCHEGQANLQVSWRTEHGIPNAGRQGKAKECELEARPPF